MAQSTGAGAAGKAGQAARKGVATSKVCGDTRVVKSPSGASVKVREEHTSVQSSGYSPYPIKLVGKPDARYKQLRSAGAVVTEQDMERLRRKGNWDGTVQVILPGAQCLIRTEAPPRSVTGKIKKHKADTFDLKKLDLLVRERDDKGEIRYVEPSALQRRGLERALLIETLGNINPEASENRTYSEQVLDAAVQQAIDDHGDGSDLALQTEAGRAATKEQLRKLLAQGVDPERAMFLALHNTIASGLADSPDLLPDGSVAKDPFSAIRSLYGKAAEQRRRTEASEQTQTHLSRLESLRAAHVQREASLASGVPLGQDFWQEFWGQADDLNALIGDYEGRGTRGLSENELDAVVPDGLKALWATPAVAAVATLALERRALRSETGKTRDDWDREIRDALFAGEVTYPGFTLAVALGYGYEAEAAQKLITSPSELKMLVDNGADLDLRLAAFKKLDELQVYPGEAAKESLATLAHEVARRPALLNQPRFQQRLLEAATTTAVMADAPHQEADVTLEAARHAAEAAYGPARSHGQTWQMCTLKAAEAVAGLQDGVHDQAKARRVLAGLLVQAIASDETASTGEADATPTPTAQESPGWQYRSSRASDRTSIGDLGVGGFSRPETPKG